MYCLAIFESGNYAFYMCDIMNEEFDVFSIVSTPCRIARQGCGYCIRFPKEFIEYVIKMGKEENLLVREIYEFNENRKKKYKKIY